MTLALRYAVRSDVGLLREGNEDSAYAGPHLLAVADGMGGHAAGEVASSATITTISSLDSERPGIDLVSALAEAVAMANMRLQELVISDPATEGMGTTLTAMLWLDGHAAICHIGDSRAYLLRSGQFYQITHDHTLVQSPGGASSGTICCGAVLASRSARVAGELCRAGERRSAAELSDAAPASTGSRVGGTELVWVSSTSATMTVMLSGPPPLMASSTSCSAALSGSHTELSVWCSVCSVTTPDRPSEHSR